MKTDFFHAGVSAPPGVNEKERIFLGATPRFEAHVREKK
jgi:hypothetical protein